MNAAAKRSTDQQPMQQHRSGSSSDGGTEAFS